MKRLMDETTDELTRSLLAAGIEHRPPPGNKAQVIVALGAGGAMGLFSSNAFAWLSTTAGKVTVMGVTGIGVAVGVAGAVWVAAPSAQHAQSAGARAPEAASAQSATAELQPPPLAEAGGAAPAVSRVASPGERAPTPEAMGEAGDLDARRADALGSSADARAIDQRSSDPASASAEVLGAEAASTRRERSTRRAAKKARAKDRMMAARRGDPSGEPLTEPAAGEAAEWSAAEQADLDSEVKLVDDMHWAARRNDRVALGRFLEQYRASFPDGQLKKEVAGFEARLERTDLAPVR